MAGDDECSNLALLNFNSRVVIYFYGLLAHHNNTIRHIGDYF